MDVTKEVVSEPDSGTKILIKRVRGDRERVAARGRSSHMLVWHKRRVAYKGIPMPRIRCTLTLSTHLGDPPVRQAFLPDEELA